MRSRLVVVVTLALILLAAGCARYLARGDELAAQGNWVAAMGEYERAVRHDPDSAEAQAKLSEARRKVVGIWLAEARGALGRDDRARCCQRVAAVLRLDRNAPVGDLVKQVTARVVRDVGLGVGAGNYAGATAALRPLRECPGAGAVIRSEENRIVAAIFAASDKALGSKRWKAALALVRAAVRVQAHRRAEVDAKVRQIEAAWGRDYRRMAREAGKRGQPGVAFVRYAQAWVLTRAPEDQQAARTLRAELRASSRMRMRWRPSGDLGRMARIEGLIDRELVAPGAIGMVSRGPADASVGLRLEPPRFKQTRTVSVAAHRYVSGTRSAPNPAWLQAKGQLEQAKANAAAADRHERQTRAAAQKHGAALALFLARQWRPVESAFVAAERRAAADRAGAQLSGDRLRKAKSAVGRNARVQQALDTLWRRIPSAMSATGRAIGTWRSSMKAARGAGAGVLGFQQQARTLLSRLSSAAKRVGGPCGSVSGLARQADGLSALISNQWNKAHSRLATSLSLADVAAVTERRTDMSLYALQGKLAVERKRNGGWPHGRLGRLKPARGMAITAGRQRVRAAQKVGAAQTGFQRSAAELNRRWQGIVRSAASSVGTIQRRRGCPKATVRALAGATAAVKAFSLPLYDRTLQGWNKASRAERAAAGQVARNASPLGKQQAAFEDGLGKLVPAPSPARITQLERADAVARERVRQSRGALNAARSRIDRLRPTHDALLRRKQDAASRHAAAVAAVAAARRAVAAAATRLRRLPPQIVQKIWSTFRYDIVHHHRVVNVVAKGAIDAGFHRHSFAQHRDRGTKDSTHAAYPRLGIAGDPLSFPRRDEELISVVDAELAAAVLGELKGLVKRFHASRRARAEQQMSVDPPEAVRLLLSIYFQKRGGVGRLLEGLLKSRYGVADIRIIDGI